MWAVAVFCPDMTESDMTTNLLEQKFDHLEAMLEKIATNAEALAAEILTEQELAKLVKVSTRSLQRWREDKQLTYWFRAGRQVRYFRQHTLLQIARLSRVKP
jgi:transcriptional regulator GlxA family with amidase domain